MRALLVSSSVCHPTGYLDHAEEEIKILLRAVRRILFLPYALFDHEAYAQKVSERFARMGHEVESVHRAADPVAAIENTEAVFVGGGNTFRLLKSLYDLRLLEPIRERVLAGMPYVGSSAGTNVAGVTIGTTNDMPIVQPSSFGALRLVPFNLNPHYIDPDPTSTHKGETRIERIAQFHEENDIPVVGLREGAMLRIADDGVDVRGDGGGVLFRRGKGSVELRTDDRVDRLMAENIRQK